MSLSARHPATPGAYLQRYDQAAPPTATLRTDIAGFVGIAERGPVGVAVAIESFRQFQAVFGSFIPGGYLAYSMRAFFENGGRRSQLVRVAAATASVAACPLGGGWTVTSSSPGAWGNAISVALVERSAGQVLADQSRSTPYCAVVPSTAGFAANVLVRLSQPGIVQFRVVASIDAAQQRIYWVDPDPGRRGGRQSPVTGFDPNVPLVLETLTYDVLVYSAGQLASVTQDLSLVPEAQNYAAILLQPIDFSGSPGALPLITLLPPPLAPDAVPMPLSIVPDAILPLTGGRDGLAELAPDDFIAGLDVLAGVSEVAILAVPDILIRPIAAPVFAPPVVIVDACPVCPPPPAPALPIPPEPPELPPVFSDRDILAVQSAMLRQCETLGDRVALLDPPWDVAADSSAVQGWRDNFDSEFGALYFPWLLAPDPLRRAPMRAVPPSGHIAGLIAATDLAIGVHKAPANANLAWVQDVTVAVDPPTHGVLNTVGINVVRGDSGRPIRAMGARTISSDPNFRFLNVRRLLCMVRVGLDLCTRWAVFEPNNPHTRLSITATVTRFLNQLWKQGALVGPSAGAAFQVVCNDSNNPPSTQFLGELLIDVGIAPSVPFEFVLLRLGRSADSLDIVERGVVAAGSS